MIALKEQCQVLNKLIFEVLILKFFLENFQLLKIADKHELKNQVFLTGILSDIIFDFVRIIEIYVTLSLTKTKKKFF